MPQGRCVRALRSFGHPARVAGAAKSLEATRLLVGTVGDGGVPAPSPGVGVSIGIRHRVASSRSSRCYPQPDRGVGATVRTRWSATGSAAAWVAGGNAMQKLIFALPRRPELSRYEFQHYWIESHG